MMSDTLGSCQHQGTPVENCEGDIRLGSSYVGQLCPTTDLSVAGIGVYEAISNVISVDCGGGAAYSSPPPEPA